MERSEREMYVETLSGGKGFAWTCSLCVRDDIHGGLNNGNPFYNF
jgi:hypothetical protein